MRGISEGIDINKTIALKQCDIFHYWHFLDKGFKFQPYVCNGFHDILMMFINLNDIAILDTRVVDCRCIINRISKSDGDAGNVVQNADLTNKRSNKKIITAYKMSKEIITFADIEVEKHNIH